MKKYFGYIRISARRQDIHGVSLQEHKATIEDYASRNGSEIVAWYEEQKNTAVKSDDVQSASS